jgi:Flp pilus assembly protein TadD
VTERDGNLMQLLAHVYLQNGRPEKAAVLLAALDLLMPGQKGVLRALALAQLRIGEARLALDTLDRVAIAGGIDAAYQLLRARAFAECGRRIEATAAMKACLAMRKAPTVSEESA